jgi:hypothetical protein
VELSEIKGWPAYTITYFYYLMVILVAQSRLLCPKQMVWLA